MATSNTVTVRFIGDAGNLQRTFSTVAKGAGDAESKLGRFASGVTSSTKSVKGSLEGLTGSVSSVQAVFGTLAAAGVSQVFADIYGEANQARVVMAQTNAVIQSTGGVANVSVAGITNLSNKLSKLAGVDDEVIQQAENVLATFTRVRNETGAGNDVFDQATASALDMSKAFGIDLQSAISLIGKALNDPISGLTKLQRANVSFTQSQKDQIKSLEESGHHLEAQKIILGELKTEFGGVAAATATPLDKLNVSVKNLEESLGTGVLPVVDDFATGLGKIADAANSVAGPIGGIQGAIEEVASAAGGPIAGLVLDLGQAGKGGKDAAAGQDALARSVRSVTKEVDDAGVSEQKYSSTLKSLAGAAKGVVSAQDALTDAQRSAADAARGVAKAQEGVAKAHQQTAKAQESLADAQQNLDRLLAEGAVDAEKVAEAQKNLEQSTRGVQRAQESLADAQQRLNEALAGASTDELTDAQLGLERATLGVAQARKAAAESHKAKAGRDPLDEASAELSLREALQQQTEAQEHLDAVKQQGTESDQNVINARRAVRDATQALTDAINGQNDAAARLREAQAGDPDFERNVAQAKRDVRDAADAVRDAQLGERDAAQAVRDAQQQVADANDRVRDAAYALRDAKYALSDAQADASQSGLNELQIINELIQKYPELQGVLANYQAQVSQFSGVFGSVSAADFARAQIPGTPEYAATHIPHYASGGWVSGPPGRPQLAVVHGGEYVVSRPQMASAGNGWGGGDVYQFSFPNSVIGSQQQLEQMITAALAKKKLRNAGTGLG